MSAGQLLDRANQLKQVFLFWRRIVQKTGFLALSLGMDYGLAGGGLLDLPKCIFVIGSDRLCGAVGQDSNLKRRNFAARG